MFRPKIVNVKRQPGGNAIGGVLVDGKAKLPFVRLASPKDEVVTGKEAAKVLGRGTWLPAQRLHGCMRVAEVVTVADIEASVLRRITVIEVKLETKEESFFFAVSQAARGSGGYIERFRLEDSLIADWFGKWVKNPYISRLKGLRVGDEDVFGDTFSPTYQQLRECVRLSRKYHAEDPYWGRYDLSRVMSHAMTGW